MTSRSIPLFEDLRVVADHNAMLFGDSHEEISGNPEMVTHLDTSAWSNLELPLAWHDLCVCTRDVDTSVETSLVVSIGNSSSKAYVGSDRAVVWTLRTWIPIRGPSKWMSVELVMLGQEGVLLLNAKPRLLFFAFIENDFGLISEICQ